MYQILQKFDIHWHDGGPSIAMMCHLRRVSDLLYNWKSCLLCYMKDVVLHCSIFFKWNKLVRVRVRVRVRTYTRNPEGQHYHRELRHTDLFLVTSKWFSEFNSGKRWWKGIKYVERNQRDSGALETCSRLVPTAAVNGEIDGTVMNQHLKAVVSVVSFTYIKVKI